MNCQQRPIKIGDKVKPYGYGGLMIVTKKDEVWPDMWFCESEEYDTHYDTYSESDLILVEE